MVSDRHSRSALDMLQSIHGYFLYPNLICISSTIERIPLSYVGFSFAIGIPLGTMTIYWEMIRIWAFVVHFKIVNEFQFF